MKRPINPPEKLLEQLEDNSAGLVRATRKLKVSGQHRDELARSFEKEIVFSLRMERLILLLLLLCGLGFCFLLHLLYPHWLPEHWSSFLSFTKNL